MRVEEIVDVFRNHPVYLDSGAGKLSKRFNCSREDIYEAKFLIRKDGIKIEKERKQPKILLFDLETSPLKAYVWGMWKQNVSLDALLSDWFLLSYSCKWLGDDTMHSNVLTPQEVKDEDDYRLVLELWNYLDQADYVIGHNCKHFDVPRIKARFLVHDLPPTSYYKQIDTLEVARAEFSFPSNRLDKLARIFGFEGKLPTNMKLWVDCMNGDREALKSLEIYNNQDVIVLEKVYLKIRPFIKSHPNFNLYTNTNAAVCSHCGHDELIPNGFYYTQTGKYQTYSCTKCGAISRVRKTSLSKKKRLLVSIPGR